jgi:oxygen-independent coproporphyrinogen-3 oxidase
MPTEGTLAPDSPEVADAAGALLGAYVHLPFCHRVCPYCDFAVTEGAEPAAVDRYLTALLLEIGAAPRRDPVDALFIGGGTPSALPPRRIGEVVDAIRDRVGLAHGAEVTVEANPEDLDDARIEGLRAAGATRLSVGVQSFDDTVLRYLGRRHSSAEAECAVLLAVEAMPSVNVDLIFGSPPEEPSAWQRSVETALGLGIDHLSAYALTVEPGTPLARQVAGGSPAPDDDVQADRYQVVLALTASAGLVRYETSNFAAPGRACRYNLITWAQGDYLGFGNGAHRHVDGVRSWNLRGVERYAAAVTEGRSPVAGEEHHTGWGREVERVMLGLRRAAGVVPGVAGRALLESEAGAVLLAAEVLAIRGDRIAVTRPLLGDSAVRALLALSPRDC